jgi:hypothetical protein
VLQALYTREAGVVRSYQVPDEYVERVPETAQPFLPVRRLRREKKKIGGGYDAI